VGKVGSPWSFSGPLYVCFNIWDSNLEISNSKKTETSKAGNPCLEGCLSLEILIPNHEISNSLKRIIWFPKIPAGDQLEVRIPVKPLIDQGTIEVTVTGITQIRSDTLSLEINILVRAWLPNSEEFLRS
jgi:hypothetical protein